MILRKAQNDHTNSPMRMENMRVVNVRLSMYDHDQKHDACVIEIKHPAQRLKLHLPDLFHGVHVFFHEIDETTIKRLKRFLYAYVEMRECSLTSLSLSRFDGQVDQTADAHTTTHIVAVGNCRDRLALQDACPKARVVNVEWLDACLTHEKRLETDTYELWYLIPDYILSEPKGSFPTTMECTFAFLSAFLRFFVLFRELLYHIPSFNIQFTVNPIKQNHLSISSSTDRHYSLLSKAYQNWLTQAWGGMNLLKGESAGWVPQHLSTWSVLEQFSGTCRVPRYLEVLRYLPGTTAFQGTRRVSAHEVYAKD